MPKVTFENITYYKKDLNLFSLSQKSLPVLKIEGGGEVNMWTKIDPKATGESCRHVTGWYFV